MNSLYANPAALQAVAALLSFLIAAVAMLTICRRAFPNHYGTPKVLPWLFLAFVGIYGPVLILISLYHPELRAPSLLRSSWRLLVVAIEAFFYLTCAAIILEELLCWRRTISLSGLPDGQTRRVYRDLAKGLRDPRHLAFRHLALMLAVGLLLGYVLSYRVLMAIIVLASVTNLKGTLNYYRPATVLFLSSSSPDKIVIHARLARVDTFVRVVSLLNVDHQRKGWEEVILTHDCVRTSSDDAWPTVVDSLIGLVPIIVVDARNLSQASAWELQQLVNAKVGFKVICIVSKGGDVGVEGSANQSLATITAVGGVAIDEQLLFPLVKHLVMSRTSLPRQERSVTAVLQDLSRQMVGSTGPQSQGTA